MALPSPLLPKSLTHRSHIGISLLQHHDVSLSTELFLIPTSSSWAKPSLCACSLHLRPLLLPAALYKSKLMRIVGPNKSLWVAPVPLSSLHIHQLLFLPKHCLEWRQTCSETIPASSPLQKLKMTCFQLDARLTNFSPAFGWRVCHVNNCVSRKVFHW